ncbi:MULTISPECIES: DmsC/YnfH family molybdoenzyme membrane anchor subunit [Sporomusa]|uniref:dimethyl sulfoxide reductase anchor subunit family protein n=1 Tax=Sporomusa TaxID=2375 RepID=UPI00166EB85F|nr:DmsC/YnfH family molybdoenzyme membrane anchor subunit [Sporomusa sp. GT1]
MHTEDLPLLVFTLLSQWAVGTFLVAVVIRLCTGKETALAATRLGIMAAGPAAVLSSVIAALHLGSPMAAPNAMNNLATSWLSREGLFTSMFIALWFVVFLLHRQGKINRLLDLVTAVLGLAAIYSTSGIYTTSVKPAWASLNTYITFFGTTALLGITGVAFTNVLGAKGAADQTVIKIFRVAGIVALACLIVQIAYLPVYFAVLAAGDAAAQATVTLLGGSFALAVALKWMLALGGSAIFLYSLYNPTKVAAEMPKNAVFLAAGLILVGEIIGRYIFYATAITTTVGL